MLCGNVSSNSVNNKDTWWTFGKPVSDDILAGSKSQHQLRRNECDEHHAEFPPSTREEAQPGWEDIQAQGYPNRQANGGEAAPDYAE
jgi:hypothetical protein